MNDRSNKDDILRLLETTQYRQKDDVFNRSEYRDKFDGLKSLENLSRLVIIH